MSVSLMDYQGGPGTGALGGPPSGHNYKRAVHRAPPKEFTVEVLPPTKLGSGYCYGMRVISLHAEASDSRSTKSSASFSDYEIWRRWEDCLWFQEILESEYGLMARQKRARLAAGKGVKKNGIYVHSDHAASFESLPPGPDANMIAKDIHDVLPRLTKKGTLFRASQATIEQRGREFEALITAFFREGLPTLVQELRETRLCRDFFGYWRRDMDHDRKRGKVQPSGANMNGTHTARNSIASSAFSMYFSASNISLQLPNAFSELPPSPAVPSMQEPSRPSSMVRDDHMRPPSFGKTPALYAPSDSSASSASSASSHSPQSPSVVAQDMTFFVSERGSLALSVPEDHADVEYLSVPLSAPARMQPSWTQDPSRPFPSDDDSDESRGAILVPDHSKHWPEGPPSADYHHNLQALPEESELIPERASASRSTVEETTRIPARRQRNNSCPDRTNRNCLVFLPEGPQSAGPVNREFPFRDLPRVDAQQIQSEHWRPKSTRDPRTPTTISNSSRSSLMAFSNFSADASQRSSWRSSRASMTSEASETSYVPSFTSSFTNGSCAEFGRPRAASPDSRYSVASTASAISIPETRRGRETAMGHQHRESITTIGSMLSEFSIDSSIMPRSLTPPVGSHLRRSLSAGSRRGLAAPGEEESWYEQQDDLIDAYFYDPGIHPPTVHPEAEVESEPQLPHTPLRKPPQEPFQLAVATPDRFPKPFRDRPPGQFHLPWSSQDFSTPSSPVSLPPSSPVSPTSPFSHALASPVSPVPYPTSPITTENVTLKAVLHDSIVLVRIARGASLLEVRDRLREKFAVQEGVKLLPSFVIGWAPPAPARGGAGGLLALRGRPRSNSASSVGSLNPQALRYLYSEQDWQVVLEACAGGKMTVRLFNAQPI
ncbi:hypothetical protein BC628DRAFT_1414378 [Trametes gibbosa]|nr:hypothetical protein BC628DRAFT_1414378 [Trametes gibbosa]